MQNTPPKPGALLKCISAALHGKSQTLRHRKLRVGSLNVGTL